jgi:hypothetical protein
MQENKKTIEKIINARTLTLGVGVLEILEQRLGYLWGQDKNENELTEQEKQFDQLYEDIRTQILDHTHIQKRKLTREVKGYYNDKQ